jgi:uncharacterized membrane protein YozB (DUF420 family)
MNLQEIPTANAALNSLSALLLVLGYLAIRSDRRRLHRNLMLSAFGVSTLFLVSYLYYHSQMGSMRFQGVGAIRSFYFAILISHSLLAAAVPFLALGTVFLGLKGRLDQHRRLARWTLPIWLYVSVTGVMVYYMLYRL